MHAPSNNVGVNTPPGLPEPTDAAVASGFATNNTATAATASRPSRIAGDFFEAVARDRRQHAQERRRTRAPPTAGRTGIGNVATSARCSDNKRKNPTPSGAHSDAECRERDSSTGSTSANVARRVDRRLAHRDVE